MKDEDTQVSMQPQIVIQQTVVPNQQPKQQAYKISNESTKFLSKLYEENKKLKKFQNSQTGGLGTNICKYFFIQGQRVKRDFQDLNMREG